MAEKKIVLEDVVVVYKNFSGAPTPFNKKGGERDFVIDVPDNVVPELESYGFRIRKKPETEDYAAQNLLKIKVNMESNWPPTIWLIKPNGKIQLDETTIQMLDLMNIVHADIVINPYEWNVGEDTGTSAYLREMYVELQDGLAMRYAELPVIR